MKILIVTVLFCMIFAFRLPVLYNSTVLALLFLIFLFILNINICIKNFKKVISNTFTVKLLLVIFFVHFVSILPTIIHSQYDFTYFNKFFGLNISLITTILFFVVFYNYFDRENLIETYIVFIFLMQSIIIMMAYANQNVLNFIQIFQADNAMEQANPEYYEGLRGLSLSTEMFFGLSCGYGLAILLYFKLYIKTKRFSGLLLMLLSISIFFVGRTVFIGFILALLYMFLCKKKFFMDKQLYKIIFLTIFFAFATYVFMPELWSKIYNASFDLDADSQTGRSLSVLFSYFDVDLDEKLILFGDGLYTNSDGSYYMHTDSGYLREIYYGGIFYCFFILSSQIFIFRSNNTRDSKVFNLIIIFYMLILEIKGEVFFTNKIILMMILLLSLNNLKFKKGNPYD
ncbi:hypothetical protein OFO12_01040 [Campylobacter sp. JMF_04 NA10]|uniref:hypothetical protein n=1 Tax=Campylobacter sp. JMF_04 NA10 TaxID=2983824 RepID=UPI0022E9FEAE|nr:hypothetical protein [Campylobacter sp. JMF_04 NA10]MDA3075954.1 hypothetical protein [Campylobacter sp. JMF_04 NA10]